MKKIKNSLIKKDIFQLFLLLFTLISLTLSQDIQSVTYRHNYSQSYTAREMKSFQLIFSSSTKIPSYVHITVTPTDLNSPNQILYFSNIDPKCTKNRQLMSQKPSGPVDLFLSKNQITSKDLYICVQCQEESTSECSFVLEMKSEEMCQLTIPGQYSYYVSNEDNQIMSFSFSKKEYLDPIASEDLESKNYITIWAKSNGQLISTNINIKGQTSTDKFYKKIFDYGDIYTFYDDYEDDTPTSYELIIEAEVGQFVTIGSNFIEKGFSDIHILPSQEEFMGYLRRGEHEVECYSVNKEENIPYGSDEAFYLSGVSFSRILMTFWIDDVGELIDYSDNVVTDGVVSDVFFSSEFDLNKHFCVSLPEDENYDIEEIVYTLKLSNHKHLNIYGSTNVYSPQIMGKIYPHYLKKGEIGIFYAMPSIKFSNDISYNMFSILGFPDMLYDECQTFPLCYYNEEKLKNIKNPRHVNRMTSFTRYLSEEEKENFEINPISAKQPLIIVNCTDGKGRNNGQSSRESSDLCQFETSIFSNKDILTLRETETYTQYILEGEKDSYKISYKGMNNIKKVYLDLLIYSGDVKLEINSSLPRSNIVHKYYLANKIFYSITIDKNNQPENQEILFNVIATLKSFYLIEFQLVKENDDSSLITNILESGINYLESIDPKSETKSKLIKINNLKTANHFPFLVNFYSLNCKFKVTRETHNEQGAAYNKIIKIVDTYGQEIITPYDVDYFLETYEYNVTVLEDDISDYNLKLCMIYASGLPLEETDTGLEQTLSIAEGVPQQFIFKKGFNKIRYTYFICDYNKNIIIYFNLIDKAPYLVTIYYGYHRQENFEIKRNTQWILTRTEWEPHCQKGEICSVTIDITLLRDDDNEDTNNELILIEPRLETTVRQISGPPVYLQKNIVKIDMIPGNSTKYYFVDIGKKEMGDVTVNYRRGSGRIYGRIVRKDQVNKDETEAGEDKNLWRDMYLFPESVEDSLRYEGYLKKLNFGPENTEDCDNGCYLLLTLFSSVNGDASAEYRFFPFSILVRVSPAERTYEDVPKVTMLINEYIIGNIATSQHERMYEFYELWIPYDADQLIIDWQSDRPSLFINVGDERPTTLNADFAFNSIGHDTIFTLSKEEILEAARNKKIDIPFEGDNSIKDIHLVLGIWTDQLDTLYTSVYSMKVHLAKNNQIDIYHVKSDQKVLCKPVKIEENSYQCLYALIFDGLDMLSHLTVYPKSQNDNAKFKLYADYVNSDKIESNDIQYLTDHIPKPDEAEFNTEITGVPYIYTVFGRYGSHLFINVISDKPDIIELLSSTYTYDEEISPNPSTAQLFHLGSKPLKFAFATSEDLLINFVSIEGKAEVFWELEPENVFYLQGQDKRLTMTSGTKYTEYKYSKLIIKPTTFLTDENKDEYKYEDEAGLVFYVTYYPRSSTYNIDQLKVGKSVEFNYRNADFPINFFVKLPNNNDVSATLNFFNLVDSEGRTRFFNGGQMLSIYAMIITEQEAYEARLNPDKRPKKNNLTIKGIYNGALNVANVFLSKKDIEKFGDNEKFSEGARVLFFWIEKNEEVKFKFERISMEITVLQERKEISATEGVYQFGKLAKNDVFNTFSNSYILNVDKRRRFMHIEFASNSGYFDWSVSIDKNSKTNITSPDINIIESNFVNGRSLYILEIPKDKINDIKEIYLNVFIKEENAEVEPRLGNYVFKYTNVEQKNDNIFFIVDDDSLQIEKVSNPSGERGSNYTITFNPPKLNQNDSISYFFRGVSKASYISNEAIQTIALTESEGFTLQLENPKLNKNGTISLFAYGILMNPRYLTILAKINRQNSHTLILYQPEVYWDEPETHQGSEELIELNYLYDYESTDYLVNDAYRKQKYQLKFSGDIPNYMKIDAVNEGEETGLPNQILYFSPTDPMGMENREQLSQEGEGKIVTMWLKKEQFTGKDKNLFITVECRNQRGACNYNLKFTGYNTIDVDSNFIYSYYVSKNNQQMIFHISKYLIMSNDNPNTYVTIYGKGSQNIILKIKDIPTNLYQFKLGSAMTFIPPSSHIGDYYELTVTANEGEYITIGGKVVTNGRSGGNLLKPNSAEVSGYLIKGGLEEECYSIADLNTPGYEEVQEIYITGVFYNRLGYIYLRNKDYEYIEGSETNVTDSTYFYILDVSEDPITLRKKEVYICVKFPEDTKKYSLKELPYSLQASDPHQNLNLGLLNIFPPQSNGIIYPHLVPKNGIVFFSGVQTTSGATKINYNMRTLGGYPKMFIHRCPTYPVCFYDDDFLENDSTIIEPHIVNRMSTWNTKIKNNSPINPEQFVIVVKCVNDNSISAEICGFETTIFSDKDEVLLRETEPFSQFILENEKHSFTLDFNYENNLQKLHIDSFIISGDVTFNLRSNGEKEIQFHKYYLANKIFFSINLKDNNNSDLKKVFMEIEAKKNSYYTIDYKLVRSDLDEITNKINSGLNYLVSIDPKIKSRSKTILIQNLRAQDGNPFITNFYSLNCKFNIERLDTDGTSEIPKRKQISLYDNYAQEVLTRDNEDYHNNYYYYYKYLISITEEDNSNYQGKMCMLYVSSIELSNTNNKFVQREIIVSENIPHRVIFEKGLTKIRYLYPHSDPSGDLAVNINLLDLAKYSVKIIYEKESVSETFEIGRSQIINIAKHKWKDICKEDQLCSVTVEIELKEIFIETEPMLEFSIRPITSIGSYLQKGIAKKDFVVNDRGIYLFTDIGESEQGELTVEFLRGSGRAFGKIVKKNQTIPEIGANWRGVYKFPSNEDESVLLFDPYLKKLYITPDQTSECQVGCYLLLFINSTITGNNNNDYRTYPFVIKTQITPGERVYQDIPKIIIQAEQYIVGNVARATSERIYEFYQIWLPTDAENVQFDWQSDVAGLYVNVGDERPTINTADFKLGSTGSDTILTISKKDILDKAKKKGINIPYESDNSIKNINLVIGIWTDKIDSIFTTIYTLKVHLPLKKKNEIDIIAVNSDQKNLCKPTEISSGGFRCLFMIIYEDLDFFNNLIIYSQSHNKATSTYMYANTIDKNIYESFEIEKLAENIPTYDNSKYNSQKDNVDYLFIDMSEVGTHLFVSVVSDNNSIIELLSSFHTYDKEITPNPSTVQLFSISGNNELILDFPVNEDIIINLVSINGEGQIYWDNDKNSNSFYNLRGKDDRLTLTSGKDFSQGKGAKLIIKSIEKNNNNQFSLRNCDNDNEVSSSKTMANPGFTFYLSYYIRSPLFNFDEIYSGKSLEVSYKNTSFPLFLYSKIEDTSHDINVVLNFKQLIESRNKNQLISTITTSPYLINGAVIKENSVYQTKLNPELRPSLLHSVEGVYDPALRTAQVYLSKDDLQKFEIPIEDKPTLYFAIDKNENKEIIEYKKITFDISIIKENQGVPVSEKVYQFGKLGKNSQNYYKLKNNCKLNYMRIEFATNSKNVDFAINLYSPYDKSNSTLDEVKSFYESGKIIMTFNTPNDKEYLYLTVFKKNVNQNDINDIKLSNYVFKYMNIDSNQLSSKYEIYQKNSQIQWYKNIISLDKTKLDLIILINKIIPKQNQKPLDIIYSLRIVPSENLINGELYNTIALTESLSIVIQNINPKINENGTITIKAEEVPEKFVYLQVIAQVIDDNVNEYLVYDGVYLEENDIYGKKRKGGSIPLWILVFIIVILVGTLLTLVLILYIFRKKNKDLMYKVQQVSFQESMIDQRKDANLLLSDNENVLN